MNVRNNCALSCLSFHSNYRWVRMAVCNIVCTVYTILHIKDSHAKSMCRMYNINHQQKLNIKHVYTVSQKKRKTPLCCLYSRPTLADFKNSFTGALYEICNKAVITARCTIVQSAVLRLYVVCPSVCNVGGSYSQGNTGKFWGDLEVGWEKAACWSTKAAISLKSVKIEKKLLWRPIGTRQSSFEQYHLRPPTAFSSLRLRFATPTQNFNRYYLRNR